MSQCSTHRIIKWYPYISKVRSYKRIANWKHPAMALWSPVLRRNPWYKKAPMIVLWSPVLRRAFYITIIGGFLSRKEEKRATHVVGMSFVRLDYQDMSTPLSYMGYSKLCSLARARISCSVNDVYLLINSTGTLFSNIDRAVWHKPSFLPAAWPYFSPCRSPWLSPSLRPAANPSLRPMAIPSRMPSLCRTSNSIS